MKKKNKFDPFKNLVLDEYEQDLEDFLNKGEYVSSINFEETKKMFEEAARNYPELQESKSITLRIKKEDLIKIKARAQQNNIPYQTLITLLIHKYVKGEAKVSL